MKTIWRAGLLTMLLAACLLADVTFDQTTRFTGGTMLDVLRKMADNPAIARSGGANLKAAFRDQKFAVYIKRTKMARIGELSSSIFDLETGTVTTINHQTRTYSKMTFAEMREQLDRLRERANKTEQGNPEFDVKVEKTGQKQTIDGESASEVLMTLTAKSAGPNGQMVVKANAWLVPLQPATQEVRDFGNRMSEKFMDAFAGSPMLGAASGGIAAAMKESSKLDGYPLLTDIQVSGAASPLLSAMGSANIDPTAPLLKMEVQSANFVSGPVDDSKFAVPAGYTEKPAHLARPQATSN